MNTYVALTCLLAVVGATHGSAIGPVGLGWGGLSGLGGLGWGGVGLSVPIVAPAISTANLIKAAPIPVVKTISAPIITSPVISTVGLGGLGGLGGWGGLGVGGLGVGGLGLGGKGLWSGPVNTWGYGLGGKGWH